MKLFTSFTALAVLTTALPLDGFQNVAGPLDAQLTMISNTIASVRIQNVGSEALKILKTGTILDDREVEKVKVYQQDQQIPFAGIYVYVSPSELDESAFEIMEPGQVLQREVDIARAHDMSSGGIFEVVTSGVLSYTALGSTSIEGLVSFRSNAVSTIVDGAEAAATHQEFHRQMKRTIVQSDCTGTQKDQLIKAIGMAQSRALNASEAAKTNAAKILEYFKQDTAATRQTVSDVFAKIAKETNSTTTGATKQYCTDQTKDCTGGVIAYAWPQYSYVVNCPSYFSQMVERTKTCHSDDKPFVTIHEMTHLREIKGTVDMGYGYAAMKKLNATQSLNHADTYALFANAIEIGGTC